MSNLTISNNNNVKLQIQSYGSAILIFIEGETEQAAYDKWLSLYNWNATSSEPNYISDRILSCWSSMKRFKKYLENINLGRLDKNAKQYKGVKGGYMAVARQMAEQDLLAIGTESYRSVNNEHQVYPTIGIEEIQEGEQDFEEACAARFMGSSVLS